MRKLIAVINMTLDAFFYRMSIISDEQLAIWN